MVFAFDIDFVVYSFEPGTDVSNVRDVASSRAAPGLNTSYSPRLMTGAIHFSQNRAPQPKHSLGLTMRSSQIMQLKTEESSSVRFLRVCWDSILVWVK